MMHVFNLNPSCKIFYVNLHQTKIYLHCNNAGLSLLSYISNDETKRGQLPHVQDWEGGVAKMRIT